ncbi:polysaccharide pyruvyl transferase family protein [Luteolibacter yonseiensis]|uniref:Polysaccharide pyruvyl transferase family protein n=1 Tax=Luteolibacter yonseiensis TaxID=1144680 RepID=A0A934VCS7_9BACT|nr:polysaccharide pyruvyl transferase family protein [Luteolibacter yonseiensis]MBK1817460.1 polysaccharide pyruvyl transferase family protein [Luteolibacter yonseiensis]
MIYLLSGSGAPNFGDELIVRKWLDHYATHHPDTPLHLDCKSINQSRKIHGGAHPETRFFFFLKALAQDKAPGSFWEHCARGFEFVMTNASVLMPLPRDWKQKSLWDTLLSRKNRLTLNDRGRKLQIPLEDVPDFTKLKLIHLVGGGYISGSWPNSGFLLGCCAALKRLFGVPVVATGLGVTPLPLPPPEWQGFIRSVLENFDLFETRDRDSHDSIGKILGDRGNALCGLDDVFLQFPQAKSTGATDVPDEKPSLHLSFFPKISRFDSTGKLIEDIRLTAESFGDVYFWLCCKPDRVVFRLLKKAIPGVKLLTPAELVNGSIPMKRNDFMITSRFHPHLIGAGNGMSGIFLAQSAFYRAKHHSVTALGSSFVALDNKRTLLETMNEVKNHPQSDRLRQRVGELSQQKREIAQAIGRLLGS